MKKLLCCGTGLLGMYVVLRFSSNSSRLPRPVDDAGPSIAVTLSLLVMLAGWCYEGGGKGVNLYSKLASHRNAWYLLAAGLNKGGGRLRHVNQERSRGSLGRPNGRPLRAPTSRGPSLRRRCSPTKLVRPVFMPTGGTSAKYCLWRLVKTAVGHFTNRHVPLHNVRKTESVGSEAVCGISKRVTSDLPVRGQLGTT